jgi:hypothetical protein
MYDDEPVQSIIPHILNLIYIEENMKSTATVEKVF